MVKKELRLTPSCGYFISEGTEGSWNLPMCVEIKHSYDEAVMKAAVEKLVSENDVLRCRVTGKDSSGAYIVSLADDAEIGLTVQYAAGKTYKEAYDESVKAAMVFAGEKIDIFAAPPLRIRCYILSDEAFLLCMVIHHYAADAVGIAAIGTMLVNHYLGKAVRTFQESSQQFSFYLEECEKMLHTKEYEKQKSYWEKELDGLKLPVQEKGRVLSPFAEEHQFSVSRQMVYEYARLNHTTIFNVVMTALSVLYAGFYKTNDTAVGFVSSDRRDKRFSMSSGNYTRMLASRLRWEENDTFRSAVRKMSRKVAEASENPAAGDSICSLPMYISYIDERQTRQLSSSDDISFIGIPIPHPTYCLMLVCIEKSEELHIGITANAEYYTDEMIEEIGIRLTGIIREMVLIPDRKLRDYDSNVIFNWSDSELIMI